MQIAIILHPIMVSPVLIRSRDERMQLRKVDFKNCKMVQPDTFKLLLHNIMTLEVSLVGPRPKRSVAQF